MRSNYLVGLILIFATVAQASWWQEPAGTLPAGTETVLRNGLDAAVLQGVDGRPLKNAAITTIDGRNVLTSDNGLYLATDTRYGAGAEYGMTFRLTAPEGKNAVVDLRYGVQDHNDRKDRGWGVTCMAPHGAQYAHVNVVDSSAGEEEKALNRLVHYPQGIGGRSLGWPANLRKIVEKEAAQQKPVDQTWYTVRYVVRDESITIYLNDHVVLYRKGADLPREGNLSLRFYKGVEVAGVWIKPLPVVSSQYEPVPLNNHLNASEIDGKQIAPESLPKAGQVVTVGAANVPFEFPHVDDDGNDHIDLASSWFQGGYLEGMQRAGRGVFNGRWGGALRENPARIQFRIPNARYQAIHLIAAADSAADSVPVVTAQFYRPLAGQPRNFSTRVPLFTAKASDVTALPVHTVDGKKMSLYLVTIPINAGELIGFDDLNEVEIELTKEVQLYRAYPDPMYYSSHQAGLPSSVHVYAMTLERSLVEMELLADEYGHVWTAPNQPSYAVKVSNNDSRARTARLQMTTKSYDGSEKTHQIQSVTINPGQSATVKFPVDIKRYGLHDVELTMSYGGPKWTEKARLAYLHEDTRTRGDWDWGRGPIFGVWNWNGGHHTPSGYHQSLLAAKAGAESRLGTLEGVGISDEEKQLARDMKMKTFMFGQRTIRITDGLAHAYRNGTPDPKVALAEMMEGLEKDRVPETEISKPELLAFFSEPHLGPITYGTLPSYYGEPEAVLTPDEEKNYHDYHEAFVIGARAAKKKWPGVQTLLPWGNPLFGVPFIRRSKEVRELMDGVAVDVPVFERLPEQQIHQVSLHRMYMLKNEMDKVGMKDMKFPMIEGLAFPALPGALTHQEQANSTVRGALIMIAYGVDAQVSTTATHDSGDYWGEQHYGSGGLHERIPINTPRISYVAYATMTRHLNRKNLAKWIHTGSLSTYAMQFAHYKTGELTHVMWTIRGKRPVTLDVPKGTVVRVYDQEDNHIELAENNGKVTFTITNSPVYVEGLTGDAVITLGEPDHSDSQPSQYAKQLDNIGKSKWQISDERDMDYEESNLFAVRRFQGKMTAKSVKAPKEQGRSALAIHLEDQPIDRKVMPYYTTLVPPAPVKIEGKASHIGLWVKASSDWGRVVYTLRDAKGEKWISIGQSNQWNCDDTHNWSVFCFDGWRYLRFEMPSNAPYDTYRENGSTWWGSYSEGDGIIDLPLSLEKIIVERRSSAMYVNDLQPASKDDVLLGDMYAEYASEDDMGEEVIRLSRLRMPVPADAPELGNPIADFAASGVHPGKPVAVTKITLPAQQADGTRCDVHFEKVKGAVHYDVWVSPYPDGRGALQLGKGWKEPGGRIQGLRPETDFYIFVVYTDAEGKKSKPSPGYKIKLVDMFGMK